MVNGRFITAARAILGWSTKDLAEQASVSPTTINQIENAEISPQGRTLDRILDVLARAGIIITPDGVRQRGSIRQISQQGWFMELLEDVSWTLKNAYKKELLILYADDRISPPHVVEKYRELRASGITMRQLVEEGNEYLHGPVEEYRFVPTSHYKNWVTLIYGNSIAFSIDDRQGCTIITDKNVAVVEKLKFELLWSVLKQPEKSISDVRY